MGCDQCPWREGVVILKNKNTFPGCSLYEVEPELFLQMIKLRNFFGKLERLTGHHSKSKDVPIDHAYCIGTFRDECEGSSVPQ